ncbi:hypothetical protein P3G22_10070, partial [Rhodopseudomonas sp. BAL398]|nr:hypothetical protein [Rhodopseudomonas sp. BAL398]
MRAELDNSLSLGLRADEWVQVRTAEEIFATLDRNGRLDELPFMPEMLKYCGTTLRVGKRAHKTCDPAMGVGGRKMARTVHLENLRCDGAAHDQCEAGCLIFWKEAWLKRVDPATTHGAAPANGEATDRVRAIEASLRAGVKIPPAPGETEPTYVCQNTQIKFATQPLKWWDLRQYWEDYSSGNVRLSQLAAGLLYSLWRTVAEAGIGLGSAMRWSYDRFARAVGGAPYPVRPWGGAGRPRGGGPPRGRGGWGLGAGAPGPGDEPAPGWPKSPSPVF